MPDIGEQRDHEGWRFDIRLGNKIRLAFGVLLLVTLALAWYFHDSVEWYERDVREIALGNMVLQDYQTLVNRTWRLLNDMQEAVSGELKFDPQASQRAAEGLHETADAIRRDITELASLRGESGAADELERLADIEQVVGQIFGVGDEIAASLAAGQTRAAASALQRLHDEGRVTQFAQMTDSAIADHGEAARRSQVAAVDLAGYITGILPILMTIVVVVTLTLVWLFSRGLTRSVRTLLQGAAAFSTGELAYRIPDLREREFRLLGEALNGMAHELAEHRARLDLAKVRLESVVEERTKALKQSNERLEAIDDNRRQLLADISHEFRTPLTVILGEAEIALRAKGKGITAYRDALRRILEQAQQTTRLVEDLLFIARAEVGESRLDLGEVPVADILDSVCKDFTGRANAKNIKINRQFGDNKPILFADPGRLRQVFAVLVDNALKYSNEGGEVEVGLENGADTATVTVSDRGIGLSNEDLKHVFERYYRSKRAESHESGTGLGLPVAKAIVEAHGGEISLQPRIGGGATCTVRLPLKRELEEAACES
jgi:two-component system OmpR family sensor kinase